MHLRHISAKLLLKNLKQHFDSGGGTPGYALAIQCSVPFMFDGNYIVQVYVLQMKVLALVLHLLVISVKQKIIKYLIRC